MMPRAKLCKDKSWRDECQKRTLGDGPEHKGGGTMLLQWLQRASLAYKCQGSLVNGSVYVFGKCFDENRGAAFVVG